MQLSLKAARDIHKYRKGLKKMSKQRMSLKKRAKNSQSAPERYGNFEVRNGYLYLHSKDKETDAPLCEKVARIVKVKEKQCYVESKEVEVVLEFNFYDTKMKEIKVSREQLQSKELVNLMKYGMDVGNGKAKVVAAFLDKQEGSAPIHYFHNELGWGVAGKGILYKHHEIIGEDECECSVYHGNLNIQPNGTLGNWLDTIQNEVIGNPTLELALTMGFTAPIVGLITKQSQMDTLLFHLYGNSTTGKSTAACLAVSPFGKPSIQGDGLIRSWSATGNAMIKILDGNNGVPIVFDEASMSQMKNFTNFIYQVAEGKEKARMNKECRLRKISTWCTTLISTGEHSLFEKTNENVGLRVRAFEFGNISWTKNATSADKIKDQLYHNYGHAGVEFVKYVLEKGQEYVLNKWKTWTDYCTENLPTSQYLDRISRKFSIVLTTAELVNESSLSLNLDLDAIFDLLHEAEKQALEERDIADKALNYIKEMVIAHKTKFKVNRGSTPKNECYGKINETASRTEVMILTEAFKKLLHEGGFSNPTVVLDALKQKGYLKTEANKNAYRTNIDNKRYRTYCLVFNENIFEGINEEVQDFSQKVEDNEETSDLDELE